MNEIKVLINFEKRTNVITGVDLTNGDYNSTKIIFEFDRNDGTKIFELKNPKNEVVFSKEIINNEVILANIDENGVFSSIFNMAGEYTFEVSLYANEGKLTSDYNYLNVEKEQVVIGDEIVEPYLPIFDELMQKINNAITETDNLDIDIQDNVVTITKKDGTVKSENVKGDAYIITDEDMQEIETNVRNDIQPILDEAKENSETAISISKGANQSKGFKSYQDLVTAFNVLPSDTYRVGQNLYIKTKLVPDLWVYEVFEESIPYTYTNDEEFVELVDSEDGIRIGHYSLGPLETQKVDLTDYVKNTDYGTYTKAGIFRPTNGLTITGANKDGVGIAKATNSQIDNKTDNYSPIVSSNLDYAVGSVFPVITQSQYDELVANGNVDENLYYCILEEE